MSSISALERIENMLDDHSFVELSSMVTSRATDFNMNASATPSDGVIIGHGLIDGNMVFIYSQDASVLGGSIGEMHAKKIRMIYDMAIKMGAPIIGFIDSTGVRLAESVDAVEAIGMLYHTAVKASGVIPQVLGIYGGCGGALSVLASICDFVYMVDGATRFMNAPDAITGNTKGTLDSSSAQFQYEEAGSVDGMGSEVEVLIQIRQLVSILPGSNRERGYIMGCVDDPNRAAVDLDVKRDNVESFVKEISDDKLFIPVKNGWAQDMVTGFIRLNGMTVGIIGNQAVGDVPTLSADGCNKAASFVRFLDSFDIPLLSLVNVKGYEATIASELSLSGAAARLSMAIAAATVPKVTLLMKEAYGSAYLCMGAKSLGVDLVYAYPDADMGIMDAKMAAKIITDGLAGDAVAVAAEFDERQQGIGNAARHGYIDRVISFVDSRKYLIDAFQLLFTKQVLLPEKKHIAK